ncbi:MAG: hypothetical protein OXI17_12240 [Gammaproteobacteria bacterium]|nr:hypothetical protein [Gammaproteobacteria bacterium]
MWPNIPGDVVEYVKSVVQKASDEATEQISNQPNVRETSLDDALIIGIAKNAAPRRLPSNAIVKIEIHNIGGLRHLERWELADIAFVVHVSSNGNPICQKIGLLQSKRLYPENLDVDAEDPIRFFEGLNGLLYPAEFTRPPLAPTTYKFTDNSIYGAINPNDDQLNRILTFHKKFGESVFYLLYHPHDVPFEHTLPATSYQTISFPPLGSRVVRSRAIASILEEKLGSKRGPSFREVRAASGLENWRLEVWVADLLLQCKVGRQYSGEDQELISRLIRRRTGPIGAAIRINVDLPEYIDHPD